MNCGGSQWLCDFTVEYPACLISGYLFCQGITREAHSLQSLSALNHYPLFSKMTSLTCAFRSFVFCFVFQNWNWAFLLICLVFPLRGHTLTKSQTGLGQYHDHRIRRTELSSKLKLESIIQYERLWFSINLFTFLFLLWE